MSERKDIRTDTLEVLLKNAKKERWVLRVALWVTLVLGIYISTAARYDVYVITSVALYAILIFVLKRGKSLDIEFMQQTLDLMNMGGEHTIERNE